MVGKRFVLNETKGVFLDHVGRVGRLVALQDHAVHVRRHFISMAEVNFGTKTVDGLSFRSYWTTSNSDKPTLDRNHARLAELPPDKNN